MHATSVYSLELSVLRGTGGKALATEHWAEDLNVPQIESVRLSLGVHAKSYLHRGPQLSAPNYSYHGVWYIVVWKVGGRESRGYHRGTITGLMPSHLWPTFEDWTLNGSAEKIRTGYEVITWGQLFCKCLLHGYNKIETILISRNGQQWKRLSKCLKPCYSIETNLYSQGKCGRVQGKERAASKRVHRLGRWKF